MDGDVNRLVECHSGYIYAQRPQFIHWQGERLAIIEIIQEWHIPEGRRFIVKTPNNAFELLYNEYDDSWQIGVV